MAETVSGIIGADGRLEQADARLLALHSAAGGAPDAPLAVPALARLAQLAQTLNITVSRSVIVAEGDHDLELQVRAQPEGTGVRLELEGWTIRPQRQPWLIGDPAQAEEPPVPRPQISWSVDRALKFTQCGGIDDAQAAIGKPLTHVFRLIDDAQEAMPILSALAAQGDFSGQHAVLRSDATVEVELEAIVLRDVHGAFSGYLGTARAVDSTLPAAVPAAPAADMAFVERLDGALRNPLARIAASADQINAQVEGPLRRDYADYAGDIGSAARHLLALVDDLSDLQAIEREGFAVDCEAIDLADVARRAAGLLQVRASDRGVRIDRPDETELLPAHGDFRRTLQIVVNLIGNAVRYSPEGAQVWLRTERDEDSAVLIVADQGKGIAADDQVRIFEKFERVDPSEAEGSGLGLYISRRLARAMGGDITVDSAPGQGARFVLTLPAA